MKTRVLFLSAVCNLFLLSSCAIKDDDTMTEKILKHSVNAPAYIVIGAGAIATEGSKAILTAVCVPPYMAYKHLTKDDSNATIDLNQTKDVIEE